MAPRIRSSGRWLLASTAAIILCFSGATFVSQRAAAIIDDANSGIAGNAAPSIATLSSARSSLQRLELALAAWIADGDDARKLDLANQRQARQELDDELAHYLALPAFPGEKGVQDETRRELDRLDDAVATVLEAPDSVEARRSFDAGAHPDALVLDRQLSSLVRINAAMANALATRSERARVRSRAIAYVLDGASALLAMLVAFLVARILRESADALEEHDRLVSSRADELEQFAGRMAHDVMSPLAAVSLALAYTRDHAGDPRAQPLVRRGLSALERCRRIVDALLDFARAGGRPLPGEHARLCEVLDGVVDGCRDQADEAHVELAVGPCPSVEVACSEGALASILSNLVRNAIKYIGDTDDRRVTTTAIDEGTSVRIEVIDTGPGLPPGMGERIFEPYVRAPGTSQPGIGLGLATVQRLVRSHGGSVGAESLAPHGSRFWFDLPKYGAPA